MMVITSSEHPNSMDLIRVLDSRGSIGKKAMRWPKSVSFPFSSRASRMYSSSSAVKMEFCFGLSMKLNSITSSIPIALSIRIVYDRFCRWISGTVLEPISFRYAFLVYNR
ncbi:hypothetical protein OGAPHI_007100 [Ogataea philodendri]|uniref:Uncharacterized protein n=1 Tax=Ogataea philodendri TaxID=1378263 RepID=A0A9P8SZV9_9ASCO|nr:uncharacterized protein OGAPHI_007100 [Ogataea philodendri]KAH3660514.1 hypothetical protein OGAPHI_007100 [Ogataea philodendri]